MIGIDQVLKEATWHKQEALPSHRPFTIKACTAENTHLRHFVLARSPALVFGNVRLPTDNEYNIIQYSVGFIYKIIMWWCYIFFGENKCVIDWNLSSSVQQNGPKLDSGGAVWFLSQSQNTGWTIWHFWYYHDLCELSICRLCSDANYNKMYLAAFQSSWKWDFPSCN